MALRPLSLFLKKISIQHYRLTGKRSLSAFLGDFANSFLRQGKRIACGLEVSDHNMNLQVCTVCKPLQKSAVSLFTFPLAPQKDAAPTLNGATSTHPMLGTPP